METSSHQRVSMPSVIHTTCPPLLQGDQLITKHRPSRAHPQISTLSRRSALLKAPAPAVAMADGEAQWRALLHQSAESWTRRHRIEIQLQNWGTMVCSCRRNRTILRLMISVITAIATLLQPLLSALVLCPMHPLPAHRSHPPPKTFLQSP